MIQLTRISFLYKLYRRVVVVDYCQATFSLFLITGTSDDVFMEKRSRIIVELSTSRKENTSIQAEAIILCLVGGEAAEVSRKGGGGAPGHTKLLN